MRLIDGDELKEQFKDKEGDDFTAFHFYDAIDKMPTIEEHKTDKMGRWVVGRYCSNCDWSNEDVYFTSTWTGKFCPNCGSKMEGADKEGSEEE